jgi:hypothetical protein
MTQTDSLVSSGPQTAGAASLSGETFDSPRRAHASRVARRGLLALPAVALALAVPAAPALAQTGTSGYNQKPPTPTTTSTPKSGTAPSKETTAPKAATEPTKTTTTPTTTPTTPTTSTSPSQSTLPFTGLNLTWVLAAGLLLLAGGLSIRVIQRRGARN